MNSFSPQRTRKSRGSKQGVELRSVLDRTYGNTPFPHPSGTPSGSKIIAMACYVAATETQFAVPCGIGSSSTSAPGSNSALLLLCKHCRVLPVTSRGPSVGARNDLSAVPFRYSYTLVAIQEGQIRVKVNASPTLSILQFFPKVLLEPV